MSIFSRAFRLVWLLLGAAGCIGAYPPASGADEFAFFHENVMGTSLELSVAADNEEGARLAEGRALAEIDRLAAIFSGYDNQSEFSRWQQSRDWNTYANIRRALRGPVCV